MYQGAANEPLKDVAGLVVWALLSTAPAFAEGTSRELTPGLTPGPMPVGDLFLLGMGYLDFVPTAAQLLEPGEWQIDLVASAANTWAQSGGVEVALTERTERAPIDLELLEELAERSPDGGLVALDGEVRAAVVTLRRGLVERFELALTIPLVDYGGGSLDGLAESFHDLFGLSQTGRKGTVKDEYLVFLDSRQGGLFMTDPPGSGIGNVVLAGKLRLGGDGNPANRFALETSIKLPTANDEPIASSGEIDVGVRLLYDRQFRRAELYGAGGLIRLGASDGLGLDSQVVLAGSVAAELAIGDRTSLLLQVTASQSPFEEFRTTRIDDPAFQLTAGVRRAVGPRSVLFAAFTENLKSFNNSPDISFHLGLTQTLPGRGRTSSASP